MKKTEKKYLLAGGLLILWWTAFTFINSDCQSFWSDELASIGFIRSGISLKEMFETYLYAETNLPLYSLILYFIYRIVPYGDSFLLIPSIIFCIGGMVVLTAVMYQISKNYRAAFLTLCLSCASGALIWQGAWEIRCYSMVFFFSSTTLYMYVRKYLYPSTRNYVWYSISVLFFLWTHWFSCILLAIYGMFDVIMVIAKKISYKKLFYYIPGLALYIPWLLISFQSKGEELSNFWVEVPEWKNMFWTILFYLSGRRILWYLCMMTAAFILIGTFYRLLKGQLFEDLRKILLAVCVISIGGVIGIVFVYSAIINPNGSLYVERYFMVIAPHILLVTVYGIHVILQYLEKIPNRKPDSRGGLLFSKTAKSGVYVLLAGYLMLCYKEQYIAIRKPFQEYEAAAEYLINETDIWNEETAFISSNKYCALDGFIDYYFNKQGYRSPINVIDGGVNQKEETRFYPNYAQIPEDELLGYEKLYILEIHTECDEELYDLLEKNYGKSTKSAKDGIDIWIRK